MAGGIKVQFAATSDHLSQSSNNQKMEEPPGSSTWDTPVLRITLHIILAPLAWTNLPLPKHPPKLPRNTHNVLFTSKSKDVELLNVLKLSWCGGAFGGVLLVSPHHPLSLGPQLL